MCETFSSMLGGIVTIESSCHRGTFNTVKSMQKHTVVLCCVNLAKLKSPFSAFPSLSGSGLDTATQKICASAGASMFML